MAELLFNTQLNGPHRLIQRTRQRRLQLIEAKRQLPADFRLCVQHDLLAGGADAVQYRLRLPLIIQHQLRQRLLPMIQRINTCQIK